MVLKLFYIEIKSGGSLTLWKSHAGIMNIVPDSK